MKQKKKRVAKPKSPAWELRLYVANTTPRSVLARGNVERLCERYLSGRCRITIIDLKQQPASARQDEILAIPTLVRVVPGPPKAVIGTLVDIERVASVLEMAPEAGDLATLLSGTGIRMGNA